MISLRELQLLPMGNHVVVSGPQVIAASDHAVHALLLVPLGAQVFYFSISDFEAVGTLWLLNQ